MVSFNDSQKSTKFFSSKVHTSKPSKHKTPSICSISNCSKFQLTKKKQTINCSVVPPDVPGHSSFFQLLTSVKMSYSTHVVLHTQYHICLVWSIPKGIAYSIDLPFNNNFSISSYELGTNLGFLKILYNNSLQQLAVCSIISFRTQSFYYVRIQCEWLPKMERERRKNSFSFHFESLYVVFFLHQC